MEVKGDLTRTGLRFFVNTHELAIRTRQHSECQPNLVTAASPVSARDPLGV